MLVASEHSMKPFVYHSKSPRDTAAFGRRIGRFLRAGCAIAFVGDLGSGKTTLIQGLASSLGVSKHEVTSPTFVLFHVYKGKFPIYHFDLYRLSGDELLDKIGLDDFINDHNAVSFVEWAERAKSFIPKDHLLVELKDLGGNERKFHLCARGKISQEILNRIHKYEHSRD